MHVGNEGRYLDKALQLAAVSVVLCTLQFHADYVSVC